MSARVLVLARDVALRSGMRRLLQRPGLEILTSPDSTDLAASARSDIDAVLVDAGLLGPEPAQQLTALRTDHPGALLIVMAGRPQHPALVVAQRLDALPLTADFDLGALVDLLEGGSGATGVREPRRPLSPLGHLSAEASLPESA